LEVLKKIVQNALVKSISRTILFKQSKPSIALFLQISDMWHRKGAYFHLYPDCATNFINRNFCAPLCSRRVFL